MASVIIWKTDESINEMLKTIVLHPSDQIKFDQCKHPQKRREFLALRCCLKQHFGYNPAVFYTEKGKPYLNEPEKISFSHTSNYAGMIISQIAEVGIDLEVYRRGIRQIAPKYMRQEEFRSLSDESEVEHLLQYWGAKEVMLKITGNRRLDFKSQLRVNPFLYGRFQSTSGLIADTNDYRKVNLLFRSINDLHISLGWEA